MKRILLLITLVGFASCSGTVDPEQDGVQEIPDEFTAPYTLEADRTEVEANGAEYVTFRLLDAYGRNVLEDSKAIQSVNITSAEGQRVPRRNDKTRFIANGTYNFTAKFRGLNSENTVSIVAKNRGKYEKFHKNVALYKATGSWCTACPGMTAAIKGMNEDTKNHSVELAWHNNDEMALKFPGSANDCGALVAAHLTNGSVAFPTVVLDLRKMVMEKSAEVLENAIWDLRADYPATCGIKVSSKYDKAKGITVNAELTSSTGGRYDLGAVVLLHNHEAGGTSVDGMYSHIVCAATGNYLTCSSAIKDVAKDGTLPYEVTFPVSEIDVENITVAVFALVKDDKGARMDNIVEARLGESVGYAYNE